MNRTWIIAISLILLLAACSKTPKVTTPELEGIFSDKDIDNATLSLATQVEDALGLQEAEVSGLTQGNTLPNHNADVKSDFEAQAILPNTSGYVYYFRYEPGQPNPWIIERANQISESFQFIYTGQREIQAVGGGLDGVSIVMSMRETTSSTSDFEIYRLSIGNNTVQKLTNNSVDDTNVSLSADGSTLAWQTLVSGAPSIIFRKYSSSTTFTQKRLVVPASGREPSISSNGRFITYIHDRPDGKGQLWKYGISSNVYTTIYSTPDTTAIMTHPSITDDGNRIMFLLRYPSNQDIQYIDLTTNQRRSAVYSTRTLEHPFITSDGKYLTYGYSGQLPSTNPGDFTVYAKEISTGQLAAVSYPDPNGKQFGMSWVKPNNPTTLFGNQQKVKPTDIPMDDNPNGPRYNYDSRFGEHIDIDGTVAITGAQYVSYDANQNGIIECRSPENTNECNLGWAYILERSSSNQWVIVKRLQALQKVVTNENEFFGRGVAISGNTAVVSSTIQNDVNGDGQFDGLFAFVYERNQGGTNNWGLVKSILYNGESEVILENDTLVLGNSIYGRNQDGMNNWGVVKQFNYLPSPRALSGDILVTGKYQESVDANRDGSIDCVNGFAGSECFVGVVDVYYRNLGSINKWGFLQSLQGNNSQREDYFGYLVAIDGNTIVVSNGAQRINGDSVYVFTFNSTTSLWTQTQRIDSKGQTYFGQKFVSGISISASALAIGKDASSLEPNIDLYTQNTNNPNTWNLSQNIVPGQGNPAYEGPVLVDQNTLSSRS